MIELKGINKFFSASGIHALDDANFTLKQGEIHALLGENGAGKSTLMHILAGFMPPDKGTIIADGKECRFGTPADALAAGIGMVRQHPHSVKGFKVWQDCILGAEKTRGSVEEVSEYWGFNLSMNVQTESLSVSQRQKAAILALILRDVRCFIFDEPAAVLDPVETEALFKLIGRLRDAGKGIVLISHKLDETQELADRITVIRRGKTSESREASSLSGSELEKRIFGVKDEESESEQESAEASPPETSSGNCEDTAPYPQPVLSVENLSVEAAGMPFIRNLSLELNEGKVLGIAGILNSGLETLEFALTGFLSGYAAPRTIRIKGQNINSVRSFREAGGAYLGVDRLGKNLVPSLPLKESLIIHAHRRSGKGFAGRLGIMSRKSLDSTCSRIMKRAGINRRVNFRADSFSGGMLQRILLAREFEEEPSLLVLSGGSWGLDQKNRRKLTERLRSFAGPGKAALLFSTDPDELLELADEIYVLRNGKFAKKVSLNRGKEAAAREIRRAMVGVNKDQTAGRQ